MKKIVILLCSFVLLINGFGYNVSYISVDRVEKMLSIPYTLGNLKTPIPSDGSSIQTLNEYYQNIMEWGSKNIAVTGDVMNDYKGFLDTYLSIVNSSVAYESFISTTTTIGGVEYSYDRVLYEMFRGVLSNTFYADECTKDEPTNYQSVSYYEKYFSKQLNPNSQGSVSNLFELYKKEEVTDVTLDNLKKLTGYTTSYDTTLYSEIYARIQDVSKGISSSHSSHGCNLYNLFYIQDETTSILYDVYDLFEIRNDILDYLNDISIDFSLIETSGYSDLSNGFDVMEIFAIRDEIIQINDMNEYIYVSNKVNDLKASVLEKFIYPPSINGTFVLNILGFMHKIPDDAMGKFDAFINQIKLLDIELEQKKNLVLDNMNSNLNENQEEVTDTDHIDTFYNKLDEIEDRKEIIEEKNCEGIMNGTYLTGSATMDRVNIAICSENYSILEDSMAELDNLIDEYGDMIPSTALSKYHNLKIELEPLIGSATLDCDTLGIRFLSELKNIFNYILAFGAGLSVVLSILDMFFAVTGTDENRYKDVFKKFIKRLVLVIVLFSVGLIIEFCLNLILGAWSFGDDPTCGIGTVVQE